jgi:magnesium-transporting ATPase (P-type)
MKKIQTLLSGLAFLVTAAVVTAHAEEAAAETNAGLAKLLDFRVAIALFVVVGICLLVSLVIWRMPRSKAKGEKDSEGQEVSDKDLEALRISYGFWLVVGALLITLLVLVITLSALAPAAPKTTDIVAIIGAVTGVIGTLTAAFFGIQAAGAGRSQALTTLDNTLKNQAARSGSAAIRRNDRGRRDWSADNCRRGQSGSCFARWEDLRSAARFP